MFRFVFFLFIVGLLCFAFGGKLLSVLRSLGQWNRNYRRLGQRFGVKPSTGGVMYGYGLTNPSLRFDYGRTDCVLANPGAIGIGPSQQTTLTMRWPDRRFSMEVKTPRNEMTDLHSRRMQPVLVNAPTFDKYLHAFSNQPQLASNLLSPAVQWELEKLRRLGNDYQLRVSIHRGELVIAKPGYIKQFRLLEELIGFGLDLFDQLMLTQVEGIDFLHQGEATIVENVKCPICSETIEHDLVVCRSCQTPHCLDCWHYNGQCATFACKETRYIHSQPTSSAG